eukprot:1325263-Amorphochlora_amoeboformis.AAC.2
MVNARALMGHYALDAHPLQIFVPSRSEARIMCESPCQRECFFERGRLTKEILSEGQGPTIPRGKLAKVAVLYTGKLESGRELGVSEGDDPVEFVVGNGNVVEGL